MTAPTPSDPKTTASLLRARVQREPVWLPVHGPSMLPTIEPGSKVRVMASSRPRRGEVWAFVLPDGNLVVHRLRSSNGGRFIFRGDNNLSNDEPVEGGHLVGRSVEVHNPAGQLRALRGQDRGRALARQALFRMRILAKGRLGR